MRTRLWRPLRWLLGLPFLAIVAAIGIYGELPSIQEDLRRRAGDAIQAAGFSWAKVDFDARDGRVSGAANSEQEQQAAIEAARANYGVRIVGDETTLIQALKPYPWSIVRDGRNVITDGYGASDADRKAVSDAAAGQLRGLTMRQNLKLARGMPPREQWTGAIAFAAAQMAGLDKGKANLDDLNLTIIGTASNPQSYTAIRKALSGALPPGVKVIEANISLPVVKPYAWAAAWKAGAVVLDGYVPDEQTHARLVSAASSSFPGAAVTDHLLLASGQPDDFQGAALVALAQLARLESGAVKLTDTAAELRGQTAEQDDAEAASQAFHKGLPGVYKPVEAVTFRNARIPIAKPFAWLAQLAGKNVEISGYVPDAKTKTDIDAFAAKRFVGFRVYDHTTVARGSQAGFQQAATAGLDLLGRLDQGSARVTDTLVEVTGHAPDPSIADSANDSLSARMPSGFKSNVVIEADKPKVVAKAPSTVLEPPKVAKPVEPPKVVEPAKPAEPPKPVVVAKPAEPVKPAEPAKSAKAPYVWDAVLDHGTVTISGGVPKGEARDLVLSLIASRLSGVTVVNNLKQVDSLPSSEDDWLHSVDAGLKAVADLGAGHAHIEDRALSVTGETSDRAMPDFIAESLRRAVPGSYKAAANVDYLPPPAPPAYLTTVKYDGLHVVVEGVVPDLATKAKFLARLKPLFPDRDFDDRTTVQHGAPDGWYEALVQGVGPLSTLGNGQLPLRDRNLYLSGTAEDQRILANARQRINGALPRGYGGKDLLTYVAPPAPDPKLLAKRQDESKYDVGKLVRQNTSLSATECQAVFNTLLRGKVFFASGRADLDPRSAQSLTSVVAIAKRCPATRVEISGHTDSDGASAFNQKLSERRAQAVVKYLTGKGVGFSRMDAVGYGETQPVAPNDSAANKAKNRRIEFAMTPG